MWQSFRGQKEIKNDLLSIQVVGSDFYVHIFVWKTLDLSYGDTLFEQLSWMQ